MVLSGIKGCSAELAMNQWIIKMFAKSVSDIEAVLTAVSLRGFFFSRMSET